MSTRPLLQFGSHGSGDSQFSSPYGVSCTPKGSLVIVDVFNNRIQLFDKSGKFERKVGGMGKKHGQLYAPAGVTVDPRTNHIVVADTCNHRIQIFDPLGLFVKEFVTNAADDKLLSTVYGVAIDLQGNYVVADYGNHRVLVFNPDGKYLRKIGTKGTENGQFSRPVGVGILANGNLVVSESMNNRIQVFDPEGNFLSAIGVGVLKDARHICIDKDTIYVADFGNRCIRVFSKEGELLKTIGGQLEGPAGVCVTREGRVVVAEHEAHRISVFLA